jgi:hypothetical protein
MIMTVIARIASASALLLTVGLVLPHGPARAANGAPAATAGGGELRSGTASSARVVSQQAETAEDVEESKESVHEAPLEVFADIEKAWVEKNVDRILSHFGEQKVWISVEGTGPSGGEFSRNQSYYLLKDLFKYTITRKFEFVQYRKPEDESKSTFAVAERHFQHTDDGRLFKDKIYVSLHLEGEPDEQRWVVDEIKSIR